MDAAETDNPSDVVVDIKKRSPRIRVRHDSPIQTYRYWVDVIGVSQAEVARVLAISQQNLCDQVQGRRQLSANLLEYLGWERVTEYRRINGNETCPEWSTDDQPDV